MRRAILLTAALASGLLLIVLGAAPVRAQSVQLVPFGGQSYNLPFYVTGAPGDPSRVFVVEGGGTIRLVKDGVTQSAPFLDINADVLDLNEGGCECGLLSIAFAPDYATSGVFYVLYTRDADPGFHYLRIQEFRRSATNPDVADPASGRVVIEIPHLGGLNHNAGQLQFGPDKLLYIWVGDGGGPSSPEPQSPNAQNLSSPLGKLLRINPRAGAASSIPADNPFVDGPGPNADEVYAYGLRNPWRGSFDRSTGDLTLGDVGQATWEEIDFKPEGGGAGANFGWDCFEGTSTYSGCAAPNHSLPVFVYANPQDGEAAVIGGYVIRDSALPALGGRYIYTDEEGALGPQLRTAVLQPGGAVDDAALPGVSVTEVDSFGQDACGHIYVATLSGPVYRLEPVEAPFPCKLAPVLTVETKSARRAARKGAIVLRVLCDEDCDATAQASIVLKGGGKASSAKRKRKRARIKARALTQRLQLGQRTKLRLELSKKQTRRLRKALAGGRRAVARIEVSASGGGGGTATVKRRVKQRA
jgi:glucose/arabinose dehydrogenase